MIKVEGVSKSYDSVRVLKNVNLTIDKGAVYGLVGANGTGKTTLLNMLSGVYKCDSGIITINGDAVYENPMVKQQIIYIAESNQTMGFSHIQGLAKFQSNIYPNFDWEMYKQLIAIFDIEEKKLFNTYSKGMFKQARFITAIASKPEVLLVDELMDGVDPIKRKLMWSVLMKETAEREMTTIIATHNILELESVCSHIGVLYGGDCVLEENVETIREEQSVSLEHYILEKLGGMSDEAKQFLYR